MIYFITGGSRGIGADLVLRAAALGHDVAFTYVGNEAKASQVAERVQSEHPDRTIRYYQLDVKNSGQVDDVVDRVVDDFDTIEVVVNNAGINRDNLAVSMSDDEWMDVIQTNLCGSFYVCRKTLPTLIGQRFGRIINVSSVVHGGGSGQANYAASKAGLHGLTCTLAKEYGRRGVTANVVVPGFFETDMTKESLPEEIRGFWKQYCPLPKGRIGELWELSAAINFLASKDASFINGQVIHVTGGLDWGP